MLAHIVFFTLKDTSEEAIDRLVDSGKEFLSGHPGTVFFAMGTLNPELDRPVNDREFQVALHVIFDSKESHDAYQVHPRHHQFIEANNDNWDNVRVFDSDASA
ncbi:MAG: Dabb family protein [Planctomycetota bacterium]|nr:Dabb family protein [Planctomycetota bacterium]